MLVWPAARPRTLWFLIFALVCGGALSASLALADPICGNGVLESGEVCDDGNRSSDDCCASDCLAATGDGTACDDGFFCTELEECSAGKCSGGNPRACPDDSVPCTFARCNEEFELCEQVGDDSLCDDGNFCNGAEVCGTGAAPGCQAAASPVDCAALDDTCRHGVCDERERACTTEPSGDPLCDRDGDGLSVENDGCPYTPAGARALSRGCSAIDFVRRPGVLFDPVADAMAETIQVLEATGEIIPCIDVLRKFSVKLIKAGTAMRTGRVCKASRLYDKIVVGLQKDERHLQRRLAMLAENLRAQEFATRFPRALSDDEGDHRSIDTELANLDLVRKLYGDMVRSAEASMPEVDAICGAVTDKFDASMTITALDDAGGFATLDDGRTVAITTRDTRSHLAPGIRARFRGVLFDDGSVAENGAAGAGSTIAADVETNPYACVDLRVVPFQRYLNVPFSQMTVLPLDGYENLVHTKFLFEDRQWLTVQSNGNCAGDDPDPQLNYVRRSLRLVVKQSGQPDKIMASDLVPGELASFPAGILAGLDATLEVTERGQHCNLLSGCPDSFFEISGTDALTMRVLGTGGYCLANYDDTEFALEDKNFVIGQSTPFPQFAPATVVGISSLFLSVDPGVTPIFQAEAYEITGNSSSYPNAQPVTEDDQFAIYQNHDFYSSYQLYPYESTGVKADVGLRWPHVIAVRNANFIQYACATPGGLVRDLIDTCGAAPDSYYRLPFSTGFPTWTMGQGNNGNFTHKGKQAYAFDFVAAAGTGIRAARGGTVISVREDVPSASNCYNSDTDPKCQGENNPLGIELGCARNSLAIKHQDGTVGNYFHMPLGGVFVAEGDQVRRGAVIAEVGNTGCSSNSHLHFQTVDAPGSSQTIRVRFETLIQDCYIPDKGAMLLSNNPKY